MRSPSETSSWATVQNLPTVALPRPLFRNPKGYLECRRRSGLLGFFKTRCETQALSKCFAAIGPIRSVCDVPCGPGRLFSLWSRYADRIMAFDLAEEMVDAASDLHGELRLEGSVGHGDAFDLDSQLPDRADLVASIRFAYYFDQPARIALWRALANVSSRHVLVHFKVSGSLRSRFDSLRMWLRGSGKRRARRHPRHVITRRDIEHEVAAAGLRLVKYVSAGQLSYSVYVLAERIDPVPLSALGDSTAEGAHRSAA